MTQLDGTPLDLFASGDEYYNWLHDANGYTILQDPASGYYVYADLAGGKLIPTQSIVGVADPASAGLIPWLNITPEEKLSIRQQLLAANRTGVDAAGSAPTTGSLLNLVIFIRFSDEAEFATPTGTYDTMFNDTADSANSLRSYYDEVSYHALTIHSLYYPTPGASVLSYQDSHPRAYYQPYHAVTNPGGYQNDTQLADREQTLLKDAITYINGLGQFPSGLQIDGDGDGYVDSLTFVIRGSPDAWADLLWPHAWSLYAYTVFIDGKRAYGFNFQLESIIDTGVLAHEMFHVLGAPDLYHYSYDGLYPVGPWDVMEWNMNPPVQMGCYMKYKYGHWISNLPQLSSPGTFSLRPLTFPHDNCYKIVSPYSSTEFFVVEYRNTGTSNYEASLPGSGMLVYRINSSVTGNASGPPDEVYIYRLNGTVSVSGIPVLATFSSNVGRTQINDTTNPSSFLTDGSPGGLSLCNIGSSGITISFGYGNCAGTTPPDAFSKADPANATEDQPDSVILDWWDATGASNYAYCLDTNINNTCDDLWISTGSTSQASISAPGVGVIYEWQVVANNTGGATYANSGTFWTFTTYPVTYDGYEPDNTYMQAKPITPGESQTHTIFPVGDEDFITFSLSAESRVILETSGTTAADTILFLYNSTGTGLIEYNDNDGEGLFSRVDRLCRVDALPAGTYYARVIPNDPETEISAYQLSYTAFTCYAYNFLPTVLKAYISASPDGGIIDDIALHPCTPAACTGTPPYDDSLSVTTQVIQDFLQPFLRQFTGYGFRLLH